MDIISGLTSLIGGGITGVVGTIVSSIYSYKSKQIDAQMEKDKQANEVELKKADAAIMAQEWSARTQITQTTADAQQDSEASKAFAAALTSEPQRYAEGPLTKYQNWLMVGLDFFRGIIRPGLTVYLSGITTLVYLQARSLIKTNMPIDQAVALTTRVVDTVLYLTTTAVLFYFGQRHIDKTK